ncbi:MAG TPA: hypothetical protein VL977_07545, partial [Solirubrobacteraceae bacterium]|nr:hypothetical protein [Solirubrobacteraceae bacterium]
YAIAVRAQRHYGHRLSHGFELPIGRAKPDALAIGMDFRADRLLVWAAAGHVWAQYVTNRGRVEPAQRLGRAGYDPQISAVLSDDDRAFVIWTDEPPPGSAAPTTVFLAHSGVGPTFHGAKALASFVDPDGLALSPGSVAAERLSSEGVALLWPDVVGGSFVIDAAGATESGPTAPSVLAESGQDLRLGAVATGPGNEIVVLALDAPRTASGFDASRQQILATRSNEVADPGGMGFGPLAELTGAGPNSDPAVAVDPDTDVAIAAWQTVTLGVPGIDYAVGTGG